MTGDELLCANCGEDDDLRGERSPDGDRITITCLRCDLAWTRDPSPRCPTCGSNDVFPAFQSIVDKSRGTQLSIQSMRRIHLCPACDADRLTAYRRSNIPLPPDELPVETDG